LNAYYRYQREHENEASRRIAFALVRRALELNTLAPRTRVEVILLSTNTAPPACDHELDRALQGSTLRAPHRRGEHYPNVPAFDHTFSLRKSLDVQAPRWGFTGRDDLPSTSGRTSR